VCTADLGFTGGKNDIGAGTGTDFIGACTPALTQTVTCRQHVFNEKPNRTGMIAISQYTNYSGNGVF